MVNEKSKQQNIPYCREDSTIHFRIACQVHESITYVTFVMKKAFKRKNTNNCRPYRMQSLIKKHSDFGGGSLTSTLGETI